MARIKILDIADNMKLNIEELQRISGGGLSSSPLGVTQTGISLAPDNPPVRKPRPLPEFYDYPVT